MDELAKKEKVYHVFQRISGTYDGANRRISLGLEKSWKECLINELLSSIQRQDSVLDVCSGTGDIAIALAMRNADIQVIGLDFSPAMLEVAKQKSTALMNVSWHEGDAMHLPFADNTFGAACISFGLRNTENYEQVLREMKRVVCPGGWVYCLDSFVPDSALIRPFYALYFRYIMPILGGGLRHRQEYNWLWKSTKAFLKRKELLSLFEHVGLTACEMKSHMLGACVLHKGKKPEKS